MENENFSSYITSPTDSKAINELVSSRFSSVADPRDEWYLALKFNTDKTSDCKNWISLQVYDANDLPVISESYQLFIILNDKTKKPVYIHGRFCIEKDCGCRVNKFYRKSDFLKESKILLPGDILTLHVEVTVTVESRLPMFFSSLEKKPKYQLMTDVKDLYERQVGSDVVVRVEDKSFKAHKAILLACSPVFSAMFTLNPVTGRSVSEISIPDIEPEIKNRFYNSFIIFSTCMFYLFELENKDSLRLDGFYFNDQSLYF